MGDAGGGALLLTFARRGEEGVIREAMAALRSRAGSGRVSAVGTEASAQALREAGADDVIVYGERQGARAVVREVRSRRPVGASIVYGGPGFSGHLKLELVALASGAGRICRCRPETSPQVVGRARLLGSVCAKALGVMARLGVGVGVCAVALCWLRLRQVMAGGGRAGRG